MSVLTKETHAQHLAPQLPSSSEQPLLPDNSKDINKYYSIENELGFLTKYGSRMREEEQFFYLVENQLKFLGEFVGKIPTTKITYLLNERNGVNFAGIRVIDMLKTTSDLTGEFTRETQENNGLTKIFQAFEDDYLSGSNQIENANVISPPQDWDYGFIFHYHKRYDPYLEEFVIDMYPLRYKENSNSIKNSKNILSQLNPSIQNDYQKIPDFLTQPLIGDTTELTETMRVANINNQDIQRATRFETLMEEQLGDAIGFYAQTLIALYNNRQSFSPREYEEKMLFLEKLRRGIFNHAKEIWETRKNIPPHPDFFEPNSSHPVIDRTTLNPQLKFDPHVLMTYADREPATIAGGGSCPVATRATSNVGSMADRLSSGRSIESLIVKNSINNKSDEGTCKDCGREIGQYFHCPRCHSNADGPIGEGGCKNCGLNKTIAKKEGYAVCD